MDIAGTKKKIQRATKVAEESYKKMNEMLERMQGMEEDLQTTSDQVDYMEYELAEQRVLLKAIAEEQGLSVEEVLDDADLPDSPGAERDEESENGTDLSQKATSRPSASGDGT
jgi:DNA anti-recombination protein RmuC